MCARNLEWGCGRGHKAGRGEEPRFETEQIPSGLGVGRIFWVGVQASEVTGATRLRDSCCR